MPPTCRASVEITCAGKRARAWQSALVLAAQQTANDALDHRLVDRLPAAPISREPLRQKYRQGLRRCEQSFAMRRQQGLDSVE
jgi:DNA polymerase IIIc chi subunit